MDSKPSCWLKSLACYNSARNILILFADIFYFVFGRAVDVNVIHSGIVQDLVLIFEVMLD